MQITRMPISTTAESKMPVSRFPVLRASLATEAISFLQVSEKSDLVPFPTQGRKLGDPLPEHAFRLCGRPWGCSLLSFDTWNITSASNTSC